MKPTLKIFIAENCPGCDEAHSIMAHIEQNHPELAVEIINITITQTIVPEAVFATPTFMLNDRIVSLGNPSPEQIARWVIEATATQS